MSAQIKICITDDQLLFRKGVASLCNSFVDVEVVMEANNGKHLLEQLNETSNIPHVALLDLNMPEMDGIETTKQLKKKYPTIKIIILTIYNEDRFILHLMECGANAYLFKECEPDEFEKAIRAVAADGYYFSDFILTILHKNSIKNKHKLSSTNPFIDITEREREILLLICQEFTTQEIAEQLFISPRTVDGHRNNLLVKTGVKNTAGLVIFAIKNEVYVPQF